MSSFVAPFAVKDVEKSDDVTVDLPDPAREPNQPIMRPRVARYAGARLILLHVKAKEGTTTFELKAPVTGTVREIEGVQEIPYTLLEFSLLPFQVSNVLRALKQGIPSFYMAYSGTAPSPDDDTLVLAGERLGLVAEACVGVMFQDRVTLAPWAWITLISEAMKKGGETQAANDWNTLSELYSSVKSVRILDHVGRPMTGTDFQVKITKADGTEEAPWTLTTGADGDLEQAARESGQNGQTRNSLFGTSGERTEITYHVPAYDHNDPSLPVASVYGSELSVPPHTALLLPAGSQQLHVQILDLDKWFAKRLDGIALARYHTNSRVEPLIDGTYAFERLAADLMACNKKDSGAYFSGWAFKDFPLVPGQDGTSLTQLTKMILDNQGHVRVLLNQWLNIDYENLDDLMVIIFAFFTVMMGGLCAFSDAGFLTTSRVGFVVAGALYFFGGIIGLNIVPKAIVFDFLSKFIEYLKEKNEDIYNALYAIHSDIPVWAHHPVSIDDNPLLFNGVSALPEVITKAINQFGTWHQKIQLIKKPAANNTFEYVAYVGGMDINDNRLETPGHHSKTSPFHDVHARITGPGAADVFTTWVDNYGYYKPETAPPFPAPAPDSLLAQSAKHIVQVSRTYFKPGPPHLSKIEAFDFAPNGERTTHDTLVRAIKSAREFIYIEDQYFTPNDSSDGNSDPEAFLNALVAAADTCRRLLVLVPTETDQIFGDTRRRAVFAALHDVWKDRFLVGCPLRRPILANPGRIASEGRCILMKEISQNDSTIQIGPKSRVPSTHPYWLWIDGEWMLTVGVTGRESTDWVEIEVLRGAEPTTARWGGYVYEHKKGAPVTMAHPAGIYVHSKIMVVDDVFVSIGSTNMNRRGLLHDGEINVFAIPEALKSASENPARELRTKLWAEHLGLPPSMGPVLLRDPIAAFELFRRSYFAGNRFTPFKALDVKPYLKFDTGDTLVMQALKLLVGGLLAVEFSTLWNYVIDPTSYLDPDPSKGPDLNYENN